MKNWPFCDNAYLFKFIAHTETLQEDQTFLINKAKLGHMLKPQWKNSAKEETSNQIVKYYSQLTEVQILQLYHVYK